MVCQKALLWQIHNAGILSVEGVMGMDLIDREDAIKNIRSMDVCVMYDDMCSTEEAVEKAIVATKRNAIFGLECMPSVEPEIIHCKNCKHRDSNDCPMYYEEWIEIDEGDGYFDTDNIIHDWTIDEGFCHCAELRGEQDEHTSK